ncbi:MAG: SDR family oxidoreductase, partial [Thermoplasmata archaeon]|nr:SDR family oxidoreductase [Thermoplasmata archaeon]
QLQRQVGVISGANVVACAIRRLKARAPGQTAGFYNSWSCHTSTIGKVLDEVRWIVGDVVRRSCRNEITAQVASASRLDLLINNASELGPSPLVELDRLSSATLRRILEVNLVAPLALAHALRPYLAKARGMVVNVSSDAAVEGYPGWGGYGASKSALDLATRTLSAESGTAGITFVSVDPGDMRTQLHQAAYPGQDISDRPLPTVTQPFWSWLLLQPADGVNGSRFRAQADTWEIGIPGR